jgi:hypothetical protein
MKQKKKKLKKKKIGKNWHGRSPLGRSPTPAWPSVPLRRLLPQDGKQLGGAPADTPIHRWSSDALDEGHRLPGVYKKPCRRRKTLATRSISSLIVLQLPAETLAPAEFSRRS